MDPTLAKAVDALQQSLETILDVASIDEEHLRPNINILPIRFTSAGIGGFVGTKYAAAEPPQPGKRGAPLGDIQARRLTARVTITVRAADRNGLSQAGTAAVGSLVGLDRGNRTALGLLDISGDSPGEIRDPQQGGPQAVVEQDHPFDIRYEYLIEPEEAGERMLSIPIDLSAALPDGTDTPAENFSLVHRENQNPES